MCHHLLAVNKQYSGYVIQIDSHCHLADAKIFSSFERVAEVISQAESAGVGIFLQGGVGPEDWRRQLELQRKFPGKIFTCFGLHPYWVSGHTREECESACAELRDILEQTHFLGELGLDFREKIVGQNRPHQVYFFERQLQILQEFKKIAVFHFVRCHDEALKLLKKYKLPNSGFVHSFNSDYSIGKRYLDLGLCLSVGGPLLRENNHALQDAVKKIPLENLLVESDSPDQPPPSRAGKDNDPSTITEVISKIAALKNIPAQKVSEVIFRNNLLSSLHR